MRSLIVISILFFSSIALGQDRYDNLRSKKLKVTDTIVIDSVSINSKDFRIFTKEEQLIPPDAYHINFKTAELLLPKTIQSTTDTILVHYYRYPDFLTKSYFEFDKNLIIEDTRALQTLQQLSSETKSEAYKPFDGLSTSGSISRGFTVGNKQNSVLDSELDLQITGKISEHVSLRASIQDANVPLQENGFSQNLDEFDQIFMELYGKNWTIRAGDVQLENTRSHFASFTKKVQGIVSKVTLDQDHVKTDIFASGALVRGVFNESKFTAQEGNQGPYKLAGANGELFILIISGSEKVYVNGILLERGENEDYTMDYNAGELRFNPTYPITSDMRITVQYQVSERNFSRIIAYGGGAYTSEKLTLSAHIYSENDAKNQPLQQNLGDEQKSILSTAGDNTAAMVAPSAVPDTFEENKILYTKTVINGAEAFVFTDDPNATNVFNVKFTQVGNNLGNYILINPNAINRIFEYVAPIAGIQQGNFAPIIQLVAPQKLQTAVLQGLYTPSEKTSIDFEFAASKNDLNLFSAIDDQNNDGLAGRLYAQQQLFKNSGNWSMDATGSLDYIQERYRSPERIYTIEFERDWNIENPLGDQYYTSTGLVLSHPKKGHVRYQFEHLNYTTNYRGSKHQLHSSWNLPNIGIILNGSALKSNGQLLNTAFFRLQSGIIYRFPKQWVGAKLGMEDNRQIDKNTTQLHTNSHRFSTHEIYTGIGDSTRVFSEIGYRYRINDSVHTGNLQKVSTSNTYFLKSRILNTDKAQLSVFVNYRKLKNSTMEQDDENSLNSRILYNQSFFSKKINWNTVYETNSGSLAQQEFTYVQVDPGDGTYTWNDYNANGIQELEEFELAQFQDLATYLRLLLPNQVFIKTHQNKFSQLITLNPLSWAVSPQKNQRWLSHFYNQTSYLIDRKIRKQGNTFELNPFEKGENELALNQNFRNTLFFNRAKQHYSTSYTYLSTISKNLLVTGLQERSARNHQVNFAHKFLERWIFQLQSELNTTESRAENFEARNFLIEGHQIEPELSYLLSDRTRFSICYLLNAQENVSNAMETLAQQKIGASFSYANSQKIALNAEFNAFINDFEGNAFSPVGYQLLNGLQPGTNYTWSLLAQKKLTKYLDLNLTYQGRKSETSAIVNTGTIQLRAYF